MYYICSMKRAFLTGGFLIMIIATLIMPGFPALHYYLGFNKTTIYSSDYTDDNHGSLLSDINYLKALVDRTSDIREKQETKTPPKPQKEVNNFVYLISGIHLHLQITEHPFCFKPYINLWHNRFIPPGNPPPKA